MESTNKIYRRNGAIIEWAYENKPDVWYFYCNLEDWHKTEAYKTGELLQRRILT